MKSIADSLFAAPPRPANREGIIVCIQIFTPARHMTAPVIHVPRLHPGQPTGTYSSCLCLAWAVDPRKIRVYIKNRDRDVPFAVNMTGRLINTDIGEIGEITITGILLYGGENSNNGNCRSKLGCGSRYRRFRAGVCEASIGNASCFIGKCVL